MGIAPRVLKGHTLPAIHFCELKKVCRSFRSAFPQAFASLPLQPAERLR